MGLTAKQTAFCRSVASGMTLADAYRSAYDCARMKPATVRRKACELMKNGNVAATVEKERQKAAKAAEWSRDKAVERLRGVNDAAYTAIVSGKAIRQADVNAFTASMDRLCAMVGGEGGNAPVLVFEREEVRT